MLPPDEYAEQDKIMERMTPRDSTWPIYTLWDGKRMDELRFPNMLGYCDSDATFHCVKQPRPIGEGNEGDAMIL